MRTPPAFPLFLFLLLFSNCNPSESLPQPEFPSIHLLVTEAGTGLAAPEVRIDLYEWYVVTFPAEQEFFNLVDSLGQTDANGHFRWENPDPTLMDGQHALSFTGDNYYAGPFLKLPDSPLLPDTLHGVVHPDGFIRFHITYNAVEVEEGVFHIFDLPPPDVYGNIEIFNHSAFRHDFRSPIDTTVTLAMKGHSEHHIYIAAYSGLAYSDYPPIPFWDEDSSLFCPARDTLMVEVSF